MGESYEYRDALPDGPLRGRGAGLRPGNRFETVRLHVLGEHLDAQAGEDDAPRQLPTRVLPDKSRTIINRVADSPDIAFDWSINPYRGCEHGCVYCYARPTHEYLGLSCGVDFESTILAKFDAATLLRKELASPRWQPQTIVMSGVTDPYQPVEKKLCITRSIVEVLAECRQPVGFITKNRLITRDLDLLTELHRHRAVSVGISITTLDASLAAKLEPRASAPADRLEAVARLSTAGIPTTVMVAPIIPGITDREVPAILKAAAEAGARSAGWVLLRLPYQIKDLYLQWLRDHFPEKAGNAEHLLRDARGGELYQSQFGTRMRGKGPVAEQIGHLFRIFRKRYGLDRPFPRLNNQAFRRPRLSPQMSLFDDA